MKTKRTPHITVVTISYNAADMIEKTLKSVTEQTFSNMQYVVIDGASIDDTKKIIDEYINFINYYISEPDRGIYHAMNKAITAAKGEWIIFMNAGDVFADNNVLEKVSKSLTDKYDIIYGDILTVKDNDLVLKKAPSEINHIHRMPFCHQAVFTRTKLLKLHPFDEKYKLSADFKLFKQLNLKKYDFKKLSIPITIYDKTGLSNSQRTKGLAENIAIIKEVDNWKEQIRLLPRLYLVKNWAVIRSNFKKRD